MTVGKKSIVRPIPSLSLSFSLSLSRVPSPHKSSVSTAFRINRRKMNCPATPGDDLYIYSLLSVPIARERRHRPGSMMCSSLVNRSRRNISGLQSYITIAITIREAINVAVAPKEKSSDAMYIEIAVKLLLVISRNDSVNSLLVKILSYKHSTLRLLLIPVNTIDRNGIKSIGV